MHNLKSKLNDVNFRILNADEFNREDLHEIFLKNGGTIPNPAISTIQIAEKNGKIIALATLQPQYHAEPIYVDPEYRDTMLHNKVIEALLKPFLPAKGLRIFVFSPNSKIFKLALRFGFKPLDYKVMVKEF